MTATAADLLERLAAAGQSLASAESLTGGMFAETLTAVPGASRSYLGGVVSYASRLKHELLGVDADLLATRGAVNAEVAAAMAAGARARLGADWALACTGVAGPDPQDGAAVGTVFIAVAGPGGTTGRRLGLAGDRDTIRRGTVAAMLGLLSTQLGAAA